MDRGALVSSWTHVAAVFRINRPRVGMEGPSINGYVKPSWDRITGKVIHYSDWLMYDTYEYERAERDYREYHKHPNRFIPTGSEGSLQRLVHVQRSGNAVTYVLTVYGDLRDYDDAEAIHEWFDNVCERCSIWQAVCACKVNGKSYVWEA